MYFLTIGKLKIAFLSESILIEGINLGEKKTKNGNKNN